MVGVDGNRAVPLLDAQTIRARQRAARTPECYDIQEPTGEKTRLRQRAEQALSQVSGAQSHRIPMLPRVAARAMKLANDPRVSIRQLESVIQPDPMLTARVLAIANSPMYGAGKRITSLRTALMLLGVGLMRDVLYQTVAEAHIFRGASEAFLRRQRLHAVAVAYLTRELSQELGLPSDYAFLAGLLHDVGATILKQQLDKLPREEIQETEIDGVIELIHPHVGEIVCKRWKLPAIVAEATRRHHVYRDWAPDAYSPMGHTLAACESLADHVGLSESGAREALDDKGLERLFTLGLDQRRIDALVNRAEELRAQIAG